MNAPVVCFISTPSSFLIDERVFPFLGVLKLPPMLERQGIASEVLDLSGIENYLEVLRAHVQTTPSRFFGITATTPQFPAAVQIAKIIREVRPDARTILGGTHATLTVAGMKADKKAGRIGRSHRAWARIEENFDVIVSGDGEHTIFPAIGDNPPKLIDADDRKSPYWLTDSMLDDTPFPARHLIDLDSYHYKIEGVRATSLIAQLGCPYMCGFCAGRSSPMLRNIRMRSDESIVEEMMLLYRNYGITGIMFYDDELNVNTGMIGLMEKIAKAGRDNHIEWKLRGFVKSERFKEDQADAMFAAGFRRPVTTTPAAWRLRTKRALR
jgi:anaerobic magnesium-protoporphyrin IX monomethyl ester cyclase